jgi:hypothetical protein
MKHLRPALLASGLLFAGLLAGVYVQHRWPVGRWGEDRGPAPEPARVDAAALAALPAERRLVLVLAGQSNAANYGSERADAGPGVYTWNAGALFQARDPLPGADAFRGSPWTRLGPRLMLTGRFDAIVLVPLAQGSSRVTDWAPGGALHGRLQQALQELQSAGLTVDYILWQQGETEGSSPQASGRDYLRAMEAMIKATRPVAPAARWIVAQATYMEGTAGNAQIREAQRLAGQLPGAQPGPDLDTLGAAYRSDGVHFNGRGLEAVAAMWGDVIVRLEGVPSPP